ncbi:PQQ-dependent sugar dehydrogenase [Pseudonocardia acidicola]|uniref:PQQ-dependent sugar dehydrogenase n=1 Tax=Pseudonocardia acidicola TaxID=2724939 RepID=A0ABX1SCA4_9PSEU|nr:PQQ-dependent sugar dehydrogenase [Pseudonocardia acidicola]NMH98507.1 PQQ-dependent sugar dehydrogenase [Pseudonocardia acidicola]
MLRSRARRFVWIPASIALALAGCSADAGSVADGAAGAAPAAQGAASAPTRTGTPQLRVSTVAAGLAHPWDLGLLPDGQVLVSERGGRLALVSGTAPGAIVTPVAADFGDVLVRGEGGLMGLVVHPDFAQSRRFTTCQTHTGGGGDVRLITWQLAVDGRSAARVADPLVGGLPVSPSGRHSGCRPTLAADGALLVGTGDTARSTVPQDLTSMGGKVLRVDLATGGPAAGNPFADAAAAAQRLIWTYGHRNVQGVAVRPGTGEVYTAEHGPGTDDEVNRLRAGGNYGWDPSQGGTVGGYDESVPMTDLARFPDAVPAMWSSGRPVEAIAGAAFIDGPQWGALDGALAVAALRGSKLLIMTLGRDGAVASVGVPIELDGTFGRLRAVRTGPDGALFVTSSNGSGDVLLRITPV